MSFLAVTATSKVGRRKQKKKNRHGHRKERPINTSTEEDIEVAWSGGTNNADATKDQGAGVAGLVLHIKGYEIRPTMRKKE